MAPSKVTEPVFVESWEPAARTPWVAAIEPVSLLNDNCPLIPVTSIPPVFVYRCRSAALGTVASISTLGVVKRLTVVNLMTSTRMVLFVLF